MNKLTTRYIDSICKSGRFGDGNGLFLLVQGEDHNDSVLG
jgi:hypothetical protein